METQNNFAIGSIPKHIMSIAGPMIVAQLINVLYNVIDRIYIGRIPHVATLAMGGLGICLPIISIVMAFANLFGMGGSPLCSIARGQGKNDDAEEIMGEFIFFTCHLWNYSYDCWFYFQRRYFMGFWCQ